MTKNLISQPKPDAGIKKVVHKTKRNLAGEVQLKLTLLFYDTQQKRARMKRIKNKDY